jgi:hypothetical protein
MLAHLLPLSLLALVIILAIAGTGMLVWYFSADELDVAQLKRDNKGRRRSDQ